MTEQQAERMVDLLERIADGLPRPKSTVKLEFELFLLSEEKKETEERRWYTRVVEIPFPLAIAVGSHASVLIDGIVFDGPMFSTENISLPLFEGSECVTFNASNERTKRNQFEEEHLNLLRRGWQLVEEDP